VRGLDTNVLVRLLTRDDPAQAEQVELLFAAAERGEERFFVSVIALCELSWTLRGRPYSLARSEIAAAFEGLLDTTAIEIQDRGLVRRALADFRHGRADFADYLLGWQSRKAGCDDTLTFDRKLDGAAGFSILL
jgi:predicted nucleic-acid-binding protein